MLRLKGFLAFLPLLVFVLNAGPAMAQVPVAAPKPRDGSPATGTEIEGRVADAVTQKPVEFAAVALLKGAEQVAATDCGASGKFVLTAVPPGRYRLVVRFVGYREAVDTVDVPAGRLDLGTRLLTPEAQQLREITVVGTREMVETRPDGLVYNAELDVTNAGTTAADVLRKAPLLTLDQEGNVSLRGAGNVRVLINNRTSSIFATNLAEALQQIPADQIKAIEVLTTPSAKYDAEGAGGVVNIVLKSNGIQGYNGSLGGTAGNRNNNLNASLNARNYFWGFNSGVSFFSNHYPYSNSASRVDLPAAGAGQLTQRLESDSRGRGYFAQTGLTYDPTAEHSFALSANLNGSLLRNPQAQYTQYARLDAAAPQVDSVYSRSIAQRSGVFNYDLNGAYTRTFAKHPLRKWEVLAQYSRNRTNSDYQLEQFAGPVLFQEGPEYAERSTNAARTTELTLQTDYTHPLAKGQTLSVGAKMIARTIGSNFAIDSALTALQPGYARSSARSNAFTYEQDIAAGYATHNFAIGKKFRAEVGARAERTAITGQTSFAETRFGNTYFNVLPNLSLTRSLAKQGRSIRLNFSQRIQRPQLGLLNPYVDQSDPQNVWYGNPRLRPELTSNYEATYSAFGAKGTLSISAFGRRTSRAIELVSFYNSQLSRTESTFSNISNNSSIGLNVFGNLRLKPSWQVGANFNLAYISLRSEALGYAATRLTYTGSLNGSYRFGKGISVQLFGGYNSPGTQLQSRYSNWLYYTTGVKKTLFKNKADLVLNAANFLTSSRKFTYVTTTDQFVNTINSYNYLRSISLSLTYRFAKSGGAEREEGRAIENNDRKDGGGKQTQRGPQ